MKNSTPILPKGYKIAVTILSILMISSLMVFANEKNSPIEPDTTQLKTLPTIKNMNELKKILLDRQTNEYQQMRNEILVTDGEFLSATVEEAGKSMKSDDFSGTNVQVEGVDEGDIIKTDGKYMYVAQKDLAFIVKAKPASELEQISTITLPTENASISEIFIHNNKLILIASTYNYNPLQTEGLTPKNNFTQPNYYPYKQGVYAYVYDLTNISQPVLQKEVALDGHLISSRKVGHSLYLILGDSFSYIEGNDKIEMPVLYDSATQVEVVSPESFAYFPDTTGSSITHILTIDLDNVSKEVNRQSILGGSENLYMSTDNIYITATAYNSSHKEFNSSTITNIYKFALVDTIPAYTAEGKVTGYIINQFAMDEYNDNFRIATTTSQRRQPVSNGIYILDSHLKNIGSVQGIAPNETIHSVRFMEGIAYMVTFEITDPFFVIDLKDPTNPKVLGELKIPGYSNYLHPYDENHVIGIGRDVAIVNGTLALDQGMKLSLFDISDFNNPTEKFNTIIGTRGTNSEVLSNHRALLFNKEKNILTFPLSLYVDIEKSSAKRTNNWESGEFIFQGAPIYSIDLEKGFILRDRITHVNQDELYNTDLYIQRLLYIDNTLYSVSKGKIQANQLDTLAYVNAITLSPELNSEHK